MVNIYSILLISYYIYGKFTFFCLMMHFVFVLRTKFDLYVPIETVYKFFGG